MGSEQPQIRGGLVVTSRELVDPVRDRDSALRCAWPVGDGR